MCFDFHGSWETWAGEHTALQDPVYTTVSSEFGINMNWLAAGMKPAKMVLGLAFYGKQWTLQSLSTGTGLKAPTSSTVNGGLVVSRSRTATSSPSRN